MDVFVENHDGSLATAAKTGACPDLVLFLAVFCRAMIDHHLLKMFEDCGSTFGSAGFTHTDLNFYRPLFAGPPYRASWH